MHPSKQVKKVQFSKLRLGQQFIYERVKYMRCGFGSWYPTRANQGLAVRMARGDVEIFEEDTKVTPIKK